MSAIVGTIEFCGSEWELCRLDDCVKLNDAQLASLDREYEIVDRGAESWCVGNVATIDASGNLKVWYDVPNATDDELAVWFADALAELGGEKTSWDAADEKALVLEKEKEVQTNRTGYSGYDKDLRRMRLAQERYETSHA